MSEIENWESYERPCTEIMRHMLGTRTLNFFMKSLENLKDKNDMCKNALILIDEDIALKELFR